MLSVKQGGLQKGGNKCCMKNRWRRSEKDQEEIQKRIAEVERQKAEECEADRERKRERARRAKEAGPEAIRKGKYPRCTSKAASCNPGILHFLRHVRFSHNTRLPCCICHYFSLLKYLVYSKGLSVIYRSSTNALGLYYVIVALFTKLYCKLGIYGL